MDLIELTKKVPSALRNMKRRSGYWLDSAEYFLHDHALRNPQARKAFVKNRPVLTTPQSGILQSLTEDGISITSFDHLFGAGHPLWQELMSAAHEFKHSELAQAPLESLAAKGLPNLDRKNKVIRMYSMGAPTYSAEHPLIKFGCSTQVLNLVNTYFGLWSKFTTVDFWYTAANQQNENRIYSQQWHRDRGDVRIVKIFLYFAPVNENSGPTQYIPASRAGKRLAYLCPTVYGNRPGGEVYPSSESIDRNVKNSDIVTATGNTGTLVMVDTTGLHRGGFNQGGERLLGYWVYVTPASLASRREFEISSKGFDSLSSEAKFALDRKKSQAWREH